MSPIGKLLYHPDQTDIKRCVRTLNRINRLAEKGGWPFKFREPGVCLCYWLNQIGLTSPEDIGRILLANTISDAGVDSARLASLFYNGVVNGDIYHLFDPVYHGQQTLVFSGSESPVDVFSDVELPAPSESTSDSPAAETERWLESIGHKFAASCGGFWSSTLVSVMQRHSGVMNLLNSSTSAGDLLSELLSKKRQVVQRGLFEKPRRTQESVYPGLGQKTARLAILRAQNVGLCDLESIGEIGVPVDVHALAFAVGHHLIRLTGPSAVDAILSSLTAMFTDACTNHGLDPVKSYENLWIWCNQMCRTLSCNSCPFYENGSGEIRQISCLGRIATGGYHAFRGKRIDPTIVMPLRVNSTVSPVSELKEPVINPVRPPYSRNQTLVLPFMAD